MQTALSSLQGSLPTISDFSLLGLPTPPSDGGTPPAPGAPGPYTDNTHQAWLPTAPGGAAFPYSLVYVYYEQYGYIRGVALTNLTVAVLAVFLACLVVSSLAVALAVLVLVSSLTLCVCGWTWALNPHGQPDPYGAGPYGVDVNAVFVVNLITATGLGVEFLIHITAAYLENIHTERERQASKRSAAEAGAAAAARRAEDAAAAGSCAARAALWWARIPWLTAKERTAQAHGALVEMGSSVVTGITFTKLVGVLILARAPSMLFRLYYFRA
jgi:Niemann-Pick C1 protein